MQSNGWRIYDLARTGASYRSGAVKDGAVVSASGATQEEARTLLLEKLR